MDNTCDVHPRTSGPSRRPAKYWGEVLLVGIALLLLLAAATKLHEFLVIPFFPRHALDYQSLRLTAICAEGSLGIWLLSGIRLNAARVVTAICFFVFCIYSAYEAIIDATSCGCFGALKTNPWFMLSLDVCVLLLMWRFGLQHPFRCKKAYQQSMGIAAVLFPAFVVCLATLVAPRKAAASLPDLSHYRVVLDEKQWIGKPFPLLNYCDIGEQLGAGHWIVLVYHSDCSVCRSAITLYEFAFDAQRMRSESPRLAFLSMDSSRPKDGTLFRSKRSLHGTLDAGHEWLAMTPVAVELQDGSVVRALSGTAASDLNWLGSADGGLK